MKYLQALGLSILAVFAPIKAALLTVLILTVVDLITGVIAAYKRNEAIKSAELRRSLSKIVIYEVSMCLAYLAEHYLMADEIPALKLVSGMVGLIELKSILENLNEISGDNLLKAILEKLGSQNQAK